MSKLSMSMFATETDYYEARIAKLITERDQALYNVHALLNVGIHREAVEKIYAEESKKLASWQPIETAPEDGTEIILRVGSRVSAGYFVTSWDDDGALCDAWWNTLDGGMREDEPTHWQPLPPPPGE